MFFFFFFSWCCVERVCGWMKFVQCVRVCVCTFYLNRAGGFTPTPTSFASWDRLLISASRERWHFHLHADLLPLLPSTILS